MRYILAIILFLFVAAPPPPGFAKGGGGEASFRKASDAYAALQTAPRKQQYRSEWDKVLRLFAQVYENDPTGPHAAEALFMSAKTMAGLYRISRVDDHAWQAATLYASIVRDLPESPLAADGLYLAGELLEKNLAAPEEAYLRYQQLVERYPKAEVAQRARSRLAALVRHAPPPPAPVAPDRAAVTAAPPVTPPAAVGGSRLSGIRFWSNPGYTRVVLDLSANVPYATNFLGADPVEQLPPRLYLDIAPAALDPTLTAPTIVDDGLLRRIRTGVPENGKVRVVFDLVSIGQYKVFPLNDPYRLVIDISGDKMPEITAREPELQASPPGRTDEIGRVLDQVPAPPPPPVLPVAPVLTGLRRIVVDAGHGGKDPGAVGPSGLREKDVTLALARRLASKLREHLGCEVILTRDRDIYLPLEERTAIANKVGADLFISVHANATTNRQAFGIETYYLNFSKNDKAAAVAARENGTSLKEVTDLEQILFDLMANSKINESSRLAAEIQKSLVERLGEQYDDVRDLGVRQGPFYVLLGATMPSVLVEAAFISHPREEQRLSSQTYQEHAADAIVAAVKSYARAHKLIAAR